MQIRQDLNFTDFDGGETVPVMPVASDEGAKPDFTPSGCACAECCTARANDAAPPLHDSAPDLVPADVSSTASITVGSSVDVSIDTLGDHDWYRVSLVAGTTYTINTSGIAGSNPDTFLNLRDAAGTILTSDDDGGETTYSTISFTATTTGNYFIDAGTYNNESVGSYHLAIASGFTGADIAASTATTGALALNGSVNGSLEIGGDRDWYAITLTAGQTYIFRTGSIGPLTGDAPAGAVDTLLTLRDASGGQLVTNDDAGEYTYSAIRFTATTTGTYYLDVGGFGASTTGGFNLTAYTTPPLTVYSNDQISQQLTQGYWGGTSHHFNVAPGGTITFNTSGLTAAGVTLANAAFELWSDVTGIIFSSVATGGQIVLDDAQTGAFANAVYSGGITTSATVNVGTAWLTSYGTGLNSYSFQTYIHEIGHTLGLGHAGNYNGSASYASDALYSNDSWVATIMSYFDQNENTYTAGLGYTRQFTVTPMVADGVAIANLYGTNTLTRTGNTIYGFNNTSGRAVYDATANPNVSYTVFDNGGTDTLDYSGFAQNQRINLNAELFSDVGGRVGNVSIARGSVIENAIGGAGNDTIYGNAANNALTGGNGNDILLGNDGDDVLDGGAGANVLAGGSGNDTLTVSASGNEIYGGTGNDIFNVVSRSDTIIEFVGEGTDEVRTTASIYVLAANIENLTLTDTASHVAIFGNTSDNVITGNTGYDGIVGDAGNDTIRGGAGAANELIGGTGNDTYIVEAGGDTIVEYGGEGTDTVSTALANYSLRTNVENLVYTGNAAFGGVGSADNNSITGGAGADSLLGYDGADILTGGSGADLLIGGNGADQFRYLGGETGLDRITDFTSGTDRIALSTTGFVHTASFAFVSSGAPAPTTANSTFLYNVNNGVLSYDADGSGAGAAVMLAQLNAGLNLTAADFVFN